MTVNGLTDALQLTPFSVSDGERTLGGGYAGDLLSWVMGRANADDAWVTIMSNANIVAVASLADVSCIVLAEGVAPDAGVAEIAAQKGVNILGSEKSVFTLCAEIARLL
ncbi:MAG TPA: DRTGG domain-containing protein [Eubacteriales bacterium]|nr:DRTGG domain-containing protein [Eubacteriales bacterium]